MRKGYVVTWDALIALSFVILLMLGFIGLQYFSHISRGSSTFERLHSVAENAMDTMNRGGVLEEIGHYWASGDQDKAANVTRDYFDQVIPQQVGYRLEVVTSEGVHVVYDSGDRRGPEEGASDQTRAIRYLSGYREAAPRSGWAARAWLIENYSWVINLVSNTSECCRGWESVFLRYAPGVYGNDAFYFLIPGDASLSSAKFNVTWVEETTSTTTTSSTLTSSTTSTSTTSTTTLPGCHNCPPAQGCEIPLWDNMQEDEYNFHNFSIPDGSTCDLEVIIYRGYAPNLAGTNLYDIYMNGDDYCGICEPDDPNCMCKCSLPAKDPAREPYEQRGWDCHTMGQSHYLVEKSCFMNDLGPGDYYVMVDCWSPEGVSPGYWCPGDYYLRVKSWSGDPNCPNFDMPSTTTTTTTTTTSSSSTSSTTTLLAGNGQPCFSDSECDSGHCAIDYDYSGERWCADPGNCVHNFSDTCDATCYGFLNGEYGPDCVNDVKPWFCNNGVWAETICPDCGGTNIEDLPCIGTMKCYEDDPHAGCSDCTTDGLDCDFCGSMVTGQPGSDTRYDGICSMGLCGGGAPAEVRCVACESCYKISEFQCQCHPTEGVNDYSLYIRDTVGPDPHTCESPSFCDGSGTCIDGCSSQPLDIIYNSGTEQVCVYDPAECNDQGLAPDDSAVRLSHKAYNAGETYLGDWHYFTADNPSYWPAWKSGERDDDDVSIGYYDVFDRVTSPYTHHGTSIDFTAYVSGNAQDISFSFTVMPERECFETLRLWKDSTSLGAFSIGSRACDFNTFGDMTIWGSRWYEKTITVSHSDPEWSSITAGAINQFRIEFPLQGGDCGVSRACTMWIDAIEIDCTYS